MLGDVFVNRPRTRVEVQTILLPNRRPSRNDLPVNVCSRAVEVVSASPQRNGAMSSCTFVASCLWTASMTSLKLPAISPVVFRAVSSLCGTFGSRKLLCGLTGVISLLWVQNSWQQERRPESTPRWVLRSLHCAAKQSADIIRPSFREKRLCRGEQGLSETVETFLIGYLD